MRFWQWRRSTSWSTIATSTVTDDTSSPSHRWLNTYPKPYNVIQLDVVAGGAPFARRVHPDLIALIRKAIEIDAHKRCRDAQQMLTAFKRIKSPIQSAAGSKVIKPQSHGSVRGWRSMRHREFQRHLGKALEAHNVCTTCIAKQNVRLSAGHPQLRPGWRQYLRSRLRKSAVPCCP